MIKDGYIQVLVVGIVALVMLFSIAASVLTYAGDAGDSMSDATQCTDNGGLWNTSQERCQNQTGGIYALIDYNSIPLNTLFASGGVVFIIIMAMLLILVVGTHIKKR